MLRQKRARVIKKDPFTIQLIGDHGTADKKENRGQISNSVRSRKLPNGKEVNGQKK